MIYMRNTVAVIIILTSIFCQCNPNNSIDYPSGGYDYPNNNEIVDSSFFFYPLQNVASRSDSFYFSLYYQTFQLFEEKNLSLSPQQIEIFRFLYEYSEGTVIITLTQNEILVKKGNVADAYDIMEDNLTELEKQHLNYLQYFISPDSIKNIPWRRAAFDSVSKEQPQLLDSKYYKNLIEKKFRIKSYGFTINKIEISDSSYFELVSGFNKSGFWSFPYRLPCEPLATHASGFSFEANTRKKYNVVNGYSCPDDTTNFVKACQALIKAAQMDQEINLIWDGSVDTTKL